MSQSPPNTWSVTATEMAKLGKCEATIKCATPGKFRAEGPARIQRAKSETDGYLNRTRQERGELHHAQYEAAVDRYMRPEYQAQHWRHLVGYWAAAGAVTLGLSLAILTAT